VPSLIPVVLSIQPKITIFCKMGQMSQMVEKFPEFLDADVIFGFVVSQLKNLRPLTLEAEIFDHISKK